MIGYRRPEILHAVMQDVFVISESRGACTILYAVMQEVFVMTEVHGACAKNGACTKNSTEYGSVTADAETQTGIPCYFALSSVKINSVPTPSVLITLICWPCA